MGKVNYCKCGHRKETHKNKPNSSWSMATFCRDCPCNSYLNRNRPFKSDYAITILCIGIFILLSTVGYFFMSELAFQIVDHQDEPISLTKGEAFGILTMVFLAGFVYLLFVLVIDPIRADYADKKRITFPVREDEH